MREGFTLGGVTVKAGAQAQIDLRIPNLYTHDPMSCPVYVIHGRKPGPILFLSGAIHGDEINGVEIIRRVLKRKSVNRINGTLVAVPVVNIFGFISQTRYLPDRRDLNRSFPGSESGSLAGRIAHMFLTEIVKKCTHGIDLHTAAIHRDNFPQIRAVLSNPEVARMARAFNSPVILNTPIAEGTLRNSAEKLNIPVIVYEAGEALRFDEVAIRAGVKGIVAVMRELGMITGAKQQQKQQQPKPRDPFEAKSSTWVRAPKSGILRANKSLGMKVSKGEFLGAISDPFGEDEERVTAPVEGIIIGRTNIPLVNEGEALFHIARFENAGEVGDHVEEFQQLLDPAMDQKPTAELPIV
jgi:predicted deacylase